MYVIWHTSSAPHRLQALTVLGYVVRRQPAWLYRLTQHAAMKELVRVLKVSWASWFRYLVSVLV